MRITDSWIININQYLILYTRVTDRDILKKVVFKTTFIFFNSLYIQRA